MNPVVKCVIHSRDIAGGVGRWGALPLRVVARSIHAARLQQPSVVCRGEENPVGLLGNVWLSLHATGTSSLVQGDVEVDIRMLLLKMLLVQVATAPFEFTAIATYTGVVYLPVVSPNALQL